MKIKTSKTSIDLGIIFLKGITKDLESESVDYKSTLKEKLLEAANSL